MADNVIRRDIIQLDLFENGALKTLNKLNDELDKLKKMFGGIDDDELEDVNDELDKGKKKADKFKDSLEDAADTNFSGLSNGVKKVSTGLGKGLLSATKVGVAGLTAAGTAVGALVAKSVSAFADQEQLIGGVDTLFKKNSKTIQKYANDAYKTAGLSANAYMETVTSFSASMINSVGGDTAKAAKLSDMAITDMADNSNKMGTSMDSIIQTYQSLARGNFQMLDNLKLGYGGTKEELKRLLKDAEKLTGKKFDVSNFSHIVEAIHAVQDKMGITGTTAKEASETISGSLSAMKSSWQNLLPSLINGGDSFNQCVKNLVSSTKTFAKNVMPAIKTALSGVGDLIEELAPIIAKEIPSMLNSVLPSLIKSAGTILNSFVSALPSIISSIIPVAINAILQLIQSCLNVLSSSGGQILQTLISALSQAISGIASMLPQFVKVAIQLASSLISGVAKELPTLLPVVLQGILDAVNALLLQAPLFVSAAIQLIQGLIQGILSALPLFIRQAPIIIENLVSAITTALPMLIEMGISLINQLVFGILQNLPSLIQSALTIINSLVDGIISNLPVLIEGAILMIDSLVSGLVGNIDMIILAVQQLIKGLCEGIIAKLPQIVRMGLQLIRSLSDSMINNLGLILSAVIQLIVGIAQGILDNLGIIIQSGIEIIVAIIGGIIQSIPQLLSVIPEVFGALWDAITSINWLDLGKSIIKAVWEGIKSIGKGLWNGIKGLFSDDGTAAVEGKKTGDNYSAALSSNLDTKSVGFQCSTDFTSGITSGMDTGTVTSTFTDAFQPVPSQVSGVMDECSTSVDKSISNIVTNVSELPKLMGDGIKKSGKSLSESIVSVWKDAVKASVAPVNKLLDGANHILKEFGSDKQMISWKPYAKGTDGHKGGNALVNDGNGAELVQMPNGNAFIPKGKNVFIPNAPKGMKVLPADRTAQLMGKKSPTYRYADGIGDVDIWSYIDNSKGLVNKISDGVSYEGMSGFASNLGRSMVTTFKGAMSAWIDKLFEEEGALSLASYVASKGVNQWRTTVIRALKMEGQYSAANVQRTLHQMQTESGGNPRAINLWDSNAKKGIPSKGLMQVIDPTFNAYARKGFDKNIYDPLSNILASIRYAVSRYGTLAKAYRGVGYANGGFASKPSVFGEDGLEAAIPLSRDKRKRGISLWAKTGAMLGLATHTPEQDSGNYTTNKVESTTYAPHFELTISGTSDDRAMARKVKRWIAEAMEDMFDTYDDKVPQTQEI